ncbi:beta strand repeat-containing protein [Arthrobacter sp. Soil764]|uniref:beta strand repeat-containing protein n=1 Tax=Arthrobacter sp. Soil764 TaxID=1736403 RepID=UPI0006F459E9|nr:Ig-like domain-containing protein [Arthrobacter sp. Soil764]KRE91894.1 hypothetical protein ASG86_01700 [Arthrobacter sp. Soil764]
MSIAIRKMPFGLRLPSGRLAWIVTAVLLLLGTSTAAYGFWASTTSSNNAAAAADALSPGAKPAVTANGASLSVSWAAGTTVNGRAATGYTVTRYAAATGGTGTQATGGCAGTVTTLTCTEQNVPGGIWYYTVTPTIALWTGAESPRSTGVSSDSTAPVASVSSLSPTPNAAGWNTTSPVTVTITADDGPAGSGVASITYSVDGGAKQTVNGAAATISVTGDWTHTISYFATDKAGNASAAQTQAVWIDSQAPAVPSLTIPAYVNSANVAAVPVTGTAEAGARITLVTSDAGAAHSVTTTATAADTGAWSASPDVSSLDQGTVTYTATATDPAGNTGARGTATGTKDTVAPAPAQGLNVPSYVTSGSVAAVLVSGSAEAGASVTVTATSPGSAAPVTGTAAANGGSWSLNLDLGSLKDGTITYNVTVKDAAGNTSATVTASDTKDTVAPVLTITAPMFVNSSTATSVLINGTGDAGLPVNITVRDVAFNPLTKTITPSGASWSTTMDLSSLKEGTLTFTASATDAAGNTGTATAAATTTKDTAAPTVTGVKLTNGGSTNTSKASADPGDTVTLTYSEKLDLTKFCSSWTGTSLTGTATISDTGTNDTLNLAFSGCTLGTVTLGGNYLSGANATFGAQGTASSVIWDSTNNALVVTFGNAPNGSSGAGTLNSGVATGQPTYFPPQTVTDAAGNLIAAASFTAPITAKSGLG